MLHFRQMLWMLSLGQEVVKGQDLIQTEMHKLHFIFGLPVPFESCHSNSDSILISLSHQKIYHVGTCCSYK